MLLAIKATTGAVRTIEEHDAPTTADYMLLPYDNLQDDLVDRLTYQSSHHVEDWNLTGLGPPAASYVDNGHPNGWSTGSFYNSAQVGLWLAEGGPLYADRPPEEPPVPEYGAYVATAQKVSRYTGWTTSRDPVLGPDAPQVESGVFEAFFPRGVVDQAENRIYLARRQLAWEAGYTPDTGGEEESDFQYQGSFTDFPHPAIAPDYILRCYSIERNVQGSYGWEGDAGPIPRSVIRKYSASALLAELDLTREFTHTEFVAVAGGDRTINDVLAPNIHDVGVAGDYLWVLASDWWARDNQKLSLILVNKASMVEVDRIDLSPDVALERLWLTDNGRPQLIVGVDADGPWAQVIAWWSGPDAWLVQEVRYVSSALEKTTLVEDSDPPHMPDYYGESVNVALSTGRQFWLDFGEITPTTTLKVREEA